MAFVVSISISSYKESVSANFLPKVTSNELINNLIIANALERNQGTGENLLKASMAVGNSSETRGTCLIATFPASPTERQDKIVGEVVKVELKLHSVKGELNTTVKAYCRPCTAEEKEPLTKS